ncbi:hypothetical protein BLOT_015722 [Blomia tropicalis]|nr:hypothetical protein BLOT_015722 [Blomia tropicalis]
MKKNVNCHIQSFVLGNEHFRQVGDDYGGTTHFLLDSCFSVLIDSSPIQYKGAHLHTSSFSSKINTQPSPLKKKSYVSKEGDGGRFYEEEEGILKIKVTNQNALFEIGLIN